MMILQCSRSVCVCTSPYNFSVQRNLSCSWHLAHDWEEQVPSGSCNTTDYLYLMYVHLLSLTKCPFPLSGLFLPQLWDFTPSSDNRRHCASKTWTDDNPDRSIEY